MKKFMTAGVVLTIIMVVVLIGYSHKGEAQDEVTHDIGLLIELAKVITPDNSEAIIKIIPSMFPVEEEFGGRINTQYRDFTEGFAINGNPIFNSSAAMTLPSTLTVTGASTFTGALNASVFTQGGGILSTTTGATSTLLEEDLLDINVIATAPLLVATTATTLTFPASSTLTTLIPNAGNTRSYWLSNATGTPSTLTLAGNTGTILKNNSSTADTLQGRFTQFDMVRQANSDVFIYWNNN